MECLISISVSESTPSFVYIQGILGFENVKLHKFLLPT
jgi:hypothetical protein